MCGVLLPVGPGMKAEDDQTAAASNQFSAGLGRSQVGNLATPYIEW